MIFVSFKPVFVLTKHYESTPYKDEYDKMKRYKKTKVHLHQIKLWEILKYVKEENMQYMRKFSSEI